MGGPAAKRRLPGRIGRVEEGEKDERDGTFPRPIPGRRKIKIPLSFNIGCNALKNNGNLCDSLSTGSS